MLLSDELCVDGNVRIVWSEPVSIYFRFQVLAECSGLRPVRPYAEALS